MNEVTQDKKTIVVSGLSEPIRLDLWLTRQTTMSRSQLQKHIKAGRVTVNDRAMSTHHHVHNGDVIDVHDVQTDFVTKPSLPTLEPTILFEDENYLVVNKPAGLITHGGPGIHEPTLAEWVVEHDPMIAEVGDQPQIRPGIVHRLDKDVSGVMVIAKTQIAFDDLKKQFQNHSITKEYIALAHGRITDQSGRISFAIARKADKSGLMVARPKSTEGKAAETHFTVERYIRDGSFVRVQTLTGRTHQIRVHFKAIGHPLVGDPLYRIKRMKILKHKPPRLCLHAARLEFNDLQGQRRGYNAELPVDLAHYFA